MLIMLIIYILGILTTGVSIGIMLYEYEKANSYDYFMGIMLSLTSYLGFIILSFSLFKNIKDNR